MIQPKNGSKQEIIQVNNKNGGIFNFLNSQKVVPYVLISPFIISFLVLSLYPAIQAIIMSFQRVLPGEITFIGLRNYTRIMNPTFFTALQNTTIYMILTVVILSQCQCC
ncbi:alpha-arabinosides ABC transport system [Halalkalibacter hemicellulosilyticusJCM 9152]|uniref:Alpha-arabinosides ABC transport system n=1 Tax=Halalkalibacter hemicellulosilyticusJCM 9152 TaxID=1236971 RepID=W4QCL6_9BACI|nr:alpha-arabinosides ABC transport system [Halalkalibacter hemicellulosilyticusJCM 9152]